MMPADFSKKGPDPLDEGLVAAGFDGVVADETDAVLAVGDLACFRASHIASIRGTRVREKSRRTASMASGVSVGVRTEAREVNCAEFQLPRQIW